MYNLFYKLNPTYSFDFATQRAVPAGFTFSRASSGNWIDGSGIIQTANSDVARFVYAYNGATLENRGYLAEQSVTNLMTYSMDFANAAWTQNGILSSAVTSTSTPFSGVTSANLIIPNTSTSAHWVANSVNVTSGNTYCASFVVKPAGYSWIQLAGSAGFDIANTWVNFNITTGAVGNKGSGTFSYGIIPLSNGCYRVWISGAATSTTSGRILAIIYDSDVASRSAGIAGDGVSGAYFIHGQMESLPIPTSTIITTNAARQRAGDVMTGTLSTVIPGFNAAQGTMVVDFNFPDLTGISNARTFYLSDGTTSNNIFGYISFSNNRASFQITTSTVAQAGINVAVTRPNQNKVATAWNTDDARMDANGVAGSSDTSVTMPTGLTTLNIGCILGGGSQPDGTIKSIKYFNRALSSADLAYLDAA